MKIMSDGNEEGRGHGICVGPFSIHTAMSSLRKICTHLER